MTANARRQLCLTALICCGLGICAAWKVIQIVAWPQWVEVKNSSSVVARNVKLEVWEKGGKLIAHRQWSRLSPSWTVTVRHSRKKVTAKLTYTIEYGSTEYHERRSMCSAHEGWTFRIMPNGVVLSQNGDADGSIMDGFFTRVY